MKPLNLLKKTGSALILVAHPDDETVWMGGAMLRFPQLNWTVFSLCRKKDPDRYPKFLKVCKLYRAKPIISDLEDEDIMTIKDSIPEIKERVNKLLSQKKFDYLFTHGVGGEYNHFRHLGVHQAAKELLKNKKLEANQVFYFCYKGRNLGNDSHCTNDFKKARYVLILTSREFEQKKRIINKMYGFTKESFEYLSCLKTETFHSLIVKV